MELGFVGLGRMGFNMVERMIRDAGHRVMVYNRTQAKVDQAVQYGAVGTTSVDDMLSELKESPKIVWLMLPAGEVTQKFIDDIAPKLSKGDILIDGGNSKFTDDDIRAKTLATMGINYLDAGISGGIWGLNNGYATMVGGPKEIVQHVEPIFKALAPVDGYLHCGEQPGAGHFVKMVHNGIEYGMMQAYGEGFEIIKNSKFGPGLDFADVSKMWNHSSVVRSWLLELMEIAFRAGGTDLAEVRGYVNDSGEGRWTIEEAINTSTPAPVITLSLITRFQSRQKESYSAQVVAALRNQFGGHAVMTGEGTFTEETVQAADNKTGSPLSSSRLKQNMTPEASAETQQDRHQDG